MTRDANVMRPYPHPAGCHCAGCRIVFEKDTTPRWFAALRSPTLTGVVTYKGVSVDELIAAARIVVDTYQEEIPGVGEMTTEAIDRLRGALPK